MPIYEYRCPKCGEFELMQGIKDEPLRSCPTCRRKVTKLISSTSFQLKGSGWYITDYARKGGGGTTKKDGETGGTKEGGTAAKESGTGAEAGGDASKEQSAPSKDGGGTKGGGSGAKKRGKEKGRSAAA